MQKTVAHKCQDGRPEGHNGRKPSVPLLVLELFQRPVAGEAVPKLQRETETRRSRMLPVDRHPLRRVHVGGPERARHGRLRGHERLPGAQLRPARLVQVGRAKVSGPLARGAPYRLACRQCAASGLALPQEERRDFQGQFGLGAAAGLSYLRHSAAAVAVLLHPQSRDLRLVSGCGCWTLQVRCALLPAG